MQYAFFNIPPSFVLDVLNFAVKYYVPIFLMFFAFILSLYFLIKIWRNFVSYRKYKKDILILQKQIAKETKDKLADLEGKEFVKAFINYLETIKTKSDYEDLDSLFAKIDISKKEIENIKNIIYKDSGDIDEACYTVKKILLND